MINIALVQMCASGTKAENLNLIRKMVGNASEGAKELDVVCLSEYCYGVPTADTSFKLAESIPGIYSEEMAKLAKKFNINISAAPPSLIPGVLEPYRQVADRRCCTAPSTWSMKST